MRLPTQDVPFRTFTCAAPTRPTLTPSLTEAPLAPSRLAVLSTPGHNGDGAWVDPVLSRASMMSVNISPISIKLPYACSRLY